MIDGDKHFGDKKWTTAEDYANVFMSFWFADGNSRKLGEVMIFVVIYTRK